MLIVKRWAYCVTVSYALSSGAVLAQDIQKFNPFTVDSEKCDSGASYRGCTADKSDCLKAPANYHFVKESLYVEPIKGVGKVKRCNFTSNETEKTLETKSGLKVKASLINEVCVNAHAETGSGVRKAFTSAWVHCQLTGEWQQFE